MNVWEQIWLNDPYSDQNVRELKAKGKLDYFQIMNVNFDNFHKVTDVGCGGGYVVKEFFKRTNKSNIDFMLIDASQNAIALANQNLKEINIKLEYKLVDFNNHVDLGLYKTDLIFCFCLLEHVINLHTAIDSLYNMLDENGKILLVWSNRKSIFRLQHLLFELINLWKYDYTNELNINEITNLFTEKFDILNYKVMPCNGGKGLL